MGKPHSNKLGDEEKPNSQVDFEKMALKGKKESSNMMTGGH